jgi:hypothetical protein
VNAPDTFALPNQDHFKQNHGMDKQAGPAEGFRGFVRWAVTPPQSIAVYLVVLLLVAGILFYVGTLKPKKAVGLAPPPMSVPRN